MSFSTSQYHWSDIDNANSNAGVNSKLYAGSKSWASSAQMLCTGVVLFWFYYAIALFARGGDKCTPYAVAFVVPILFPIAFACTIAGMKKLNSTDQINPVAWSTSFFQSCEVAIVMKSYAQKCYMFCIIASGMLFSLFYLSFCCYCFAKIPEDSSFHPDFQFDDPVEVISTPMHAPDIELQVEPTFTPEPNQLKQSIASSVPIATEMITIESGETTLLEGQGVAPSRSLRSRGLTRNKSLHHFHSAVASTAVYHVSNSAGTNN